jgi:hypothetical protein
MQGREDPCVLSLTMIVNVGGIYSVKISYNSPWLRVSLFRHMGIFLLEGFYTLGYVSTFGSIYSVSGAVKAITTNFGKIWTVCVFRNLQEILPSFL